MVEDILTTAKESVAQIRAGGGPQLLWLDSVRLGPHSKGDDTRPQADIAKLRLLDPIGRGEEQFSADVVAGIWAEAKRVVDGVVAEAKEAPWPKWSKAVRPESQFAIPMVDDSATLEILKELSGKSMLLRMQNALRQAVATSSDVLLFGEDIADPYGGAFKVTEGLSQRFSPAGYGNAH